VLVESRRKTKPPPWEMAALSATESQATSENAPAEELRKKAIQR
jgi:hypothetical protein